MRTAVSLALTLILTLTAAGTARAAQTADPPTAAMTVSVTDQPIDVKEGASGPWFTVPIGVSNTGTVPLTVTSVQGRRDKDLLFACGWSTPVLQPGATESCRLYLTVNPPMKANETRPFTVSATATSEAGDVSAQATGTFRTEDESPTLPSFGASASPSQVYPGQVVSVQVWPIKSMSPSNPPTRWTSMVSSTFGDIFDSTNPKITSTTCTPEKVTICQFTAPALGAPGTTVNETVTAVGANNHGSRTFTAATSYSVVKAVRGSAKDWRDAVPTWPAVSFLTPWTPTPDVFGGATRCESRLPDIIRLTLYETSDADVVRACRPHMVLVRNATVAVLNEAALGADFPATSVDQIRAATRAALKSGSTRRINTLAATYAKWNTPPATARR